MGDDLRSVAGERSPVAAVEDRVIHLSTALAVSVGTAFDHFADNALLERWLAQVADVEPRLGGKYELFWDPDHREDNSTIGCRITAIAEPELLAFQWRSPAQFKAFANVADPLTHVVVTFVPGGSGTRVHLVHSGWRSTPEWEEARLWQERAWTLAFHELEQVRPT